MRSRDMTRRPGWPGYAAAVWGFAFAVPSFYWALGGVTGASSTVAPALVQLARDRDPAFLTVLWVTGALKVVGGLLGLALARRRAWGLGMSRLLQFLAWGAGVLLVWHGALFVGQGLLMQAHVIDLDPALQPINRWYTYLWGPWFLAGGVALVLAARARFDRTDRRGATIAGAVGGLGALLLSAAALVLGVG
ncbi:DUF3995 domain-containing protein [Solihabitans fulvus]|uniref:DUF3995 domain-containing protein n=2 Tax=Solihabitans fulvus TaxID=1892852 RepID=A0A5B2XFX9_9PSEU|nr:DUF3995 domain-containing protein [Solihabitans fulvus]